MSGSFSAAQLGRIVADDFVRAHRLPSPLRDELANTIQTALQTAMRHEREAHVELCVRRRELWERTADRAGTPTGLAAEARSRANEAAYLADAIAGTGMPTDA
jgi:hypothetical protein